VNLFRISIAMVTLGAVLTASPATAQVLFRSDFNNGSSPYSFARAYANGGQYSESRVAAGGWNGTGGTHLEHVANQRQYNLGWYFSGRNIRTSNGLPEWRVGDIVYVRLRLRYDDDWRWDGEGGMSNKMIDFGMGGDGSGRIIMRQTKPSTTTCAPNPATYGPSNGGITVGIGITYTCTPAAIITYGRWHHVQFAVQTSASNTGYIKVWVDNNDFNNPTSEIRGLTISNVAGWNDSWTVGGFMTDAPVRTSGFVMDDFEVATAFDPNWASGVSTPPPDPGPGRGDTGLPWTSSFDSGSFSEWNGGHRNTTGLGIASSGCVAGPCARATLVAGSNNDNYADHHFGDYFSIAKSKVEEVYLRFYSKFDSGYVWPSEGQKLAIVNLTDGTNSTRRYQVYVKVGPSGAYLVDHSDLGQWRFWALPQNVGAPVAVRMGAWDKLKLHVRLNSPNVADGVVRLWVNDVLKVDYSNVDIRAGTAYGMNKLNLSSWSTPGGGSSGVQWWDSWELSTSDPDSDVSPRPTAPGDVSVE